ncbi:MAG: hypothetical protein ACW96X_10145, partial [Promethearchaeota archaeon]
IQEAIKSGKKFVFMEADGIKIIGFGIFFIILGLILGVIFSTFTPPVLWFFNLICPISFSIIGLYPIIDGLMMLRGSFIVLGAEGIVYKKRTGDIIGFNWEDIKILFFEFFGEWGRYKCQVHILFPNGEWVKIGLSDFNQKSRYYPSKEFPNEILGDDSLPKYFFFLTFRAYYDYSKSLRNSFSGI